MGSASPGRCLAGMAPLSKQQIYEMIDATRRGAVFHKFVINFHPVKEDTRKDLNLWELTRKTLEQIKTQFGDSVPFVATIHDDHTLLRHIHGFFIVEGRLPKEEFAKIKGLWKVASAEAWRQRRRLDRMHKSLRYQKTAPAYRKVQTQTTSRGGEVRMRDIRMQPACQHCGYGGNVRHAGLSAYLPRLQTVAHAEQARISISWKEAAPVMLTRCFRIFSQWVSWLAVVLDTSHKLFPGRLAYKHELNTIEITGFDGNHLLIGEGEYGQVYG